MKIEEITPGEASPSFLPSLPPPAPFPGSPRSKPGADSTPRDRKPGAKYRAMVEAFDGFIYISSGDYELEFLNRRFIDRLGGDAAGQKCYQALHQLQDICPWCIRDRVFKGEAVYRETFCPRENRWYALSSTPIRHAGKLSKMTIIQDITERRLAEERNRHLAYHDQLTGLPNRSLFSDRLAMAMAQAKRHRQQVAVMMLDLDRFKDINDRLGHRVGDALLQGVAQRLIGLVRQSDTVARVGGDEFILICPEIARRKDAAQVARKVLEAFGAPFACQGLEVRATASIGVALYPDHGQDQDTLVQHADLAMYLAKKAGRNSCRMFSPGPGGKAPPSARPNPLQAPGLFLGEEA